MDMLDLTAFKVPSDSPYGGDGARRPACQRADRECVFLVAQASDDFMLRDVMHKRPAAARHRRCGARCARITVRNDFSRSDSRK
jgi:hypothetical protein